MKLYEVNITRTMVVAAENEAEALKEAKYHYEYSANNAEISNEDVQEIKKFDHLYEIGWSEYNIPYCAPGGLYGFSCKHILQNGALKELTQLSQECGGYDVE